ncbi:MAG: aspartate kinase [Methanobrevibacter boviskoreani]|jgi:aspartate kinase|uniref:aspartate kinase n=1 Tax=Methanobrevibacter TaxID=2172 RepID=UPI0003348D23|nr:MULTISPECIES: aspartate kinase [Methanobrevibacter]AGN16446.1 aspartate kinase Ask [Methanobrevibacter sp. AbM4]MCI6774665.1 aspartate kinase [Methanobrevibacter boviskoreani]MCI6930079.1 aspartate kinase [Methanobrevibacter boviskoreani]MDD6257411.1 aspartate kinase [Methanobrevibacter boviskoreani]MDY5615003.1 aspartate kinase [Methanobrevibacter boviskoreani]
MELIVAKFGGTSVGNGSRIKKAAQSVVNEYMKGNQIVVVVSAINKTTDDLIEVTSDAMGDDVSSQQMAEILSMGEMTSTRVFASTIESLGVKSTFVDPYNDAWPIITDNSPLNAKINYKASEYQSKKISQLLDQGVIPVICGFLGRGPNNEITTIGRGGSDVTAFFLGHALKASEVVIVTDVDGVMSTDPRKIEEAEKLDKISVEEMRDIALHGAQVLHPNALKYKDPMIKAKIISFEKCDLSDKGTEIVGPFEDGMLKRAILYPEKLSILAVVGEHMIEAKGLLANLTNILAENDINIYGISAGENSMTVVVSKKDSDRAYHLLHRLVVNIDNLSSISMGEDIAMLTVVSPEFSQAESPGIIANITNPLHKNNVNIVEISSSQSAVILFVEWEDGEKALKLVREVLN